MGYILDFCWFFYLGFYGDLAEMGLLSKLFLCRQKCVLLRIKFCGLNVVMLCFKFRSTRPGQSLAKWRVDLSPPY